MYQRSSKSGLFLMEMIIVILFFSLVSAITVQLFVKSHFVSRDTLALNHATMLVQNYAEVFRDSNGNPDIFSTYFMNEFYSYDSASFTAYFSPTWQSVSSEVPDGYTVKGIFTTDHLLHSLTISVYDLHDDSVIYEVTVDKYIGLEDAP